MSWSHSLRLTGEVRLMGGRRRAGRREREKRRNWKGVLPLCVLSVEWRKKMNSNSTCREKSQKYYFSPKFCRLEVAATAVAGDGDGAPSLLSGVLFN
uniref:Uncharacterized protein n=1 Tax=Nelumbo nucifera TaxID=4432 RepID=A0A822ZKW5_NELNU|nr:TPA_asm: hypothetical protein HUJ06_016651 [Nelumbo nucifera]